MLFRTSMKLQSNQLLLFFFFSSRRRHTRYLRDWSSDVCSSDLLEVVERAQEEVPLGLERVTIERAHASPPPSRWRSRSTTASSSPVAASRGVVLQRRTANTMPASPRTRATIGMPHATMPMPPFEGVNRMCSP